MIQSSLVSFQLIIIDPQETNYKQITEAGTIFV